MNLGTIMNSKIAVVTGAGSGIGRAVSLALIADGYHVYLVGRREQRLAETAAAAVGPFTVVTCDVTSEAAVRDLFAQVQQTHGRIDVLFNNAGSFSMAVPIDQVSLDDWQQAVDVNLTAVFLCMREAVRLMKSQDPQGGRIINNGSISSAVPRPQSVAYTATKHAVTGLTKSMALDGREHDIACGQIDIGNAATEMTENMSRGVLQANGSVAVEPRMDVDAVARAVVYMAGLPLDANVLSMTVMATKMPFVGRG
jgi:NAD(P)-dependent dehydrogenase (short-subunit alcohol dehydrogenase family)